MIHARASISYQCRRSDKHETVNRGLIRTLRWKYARHFHSPNLDEFYDLTADPDEKRNLLRGCRTPIEFTSRWIRERQGASRLLRKWCGTSLRNEGRGYRR